MAKRFGRNQRRKMVREIEATAAQLSQATDERDAARCDAENERRRRTALELEMDEWERRIARSVDPKSPFCRKILTRYVDRLTERRQYSPSAPAPRFVEFGGPAQTQAFMAAFAHLLYLHADHDEIQQRFLVRLVARDADEVIAYEMDEDTYAQCMRDPWVFDLFAKKAIDLMRAAWVRSPAEEPRRCRAATYPS